VVISNKTTTRSVAKFLYRAGLAFILLLFNLLCGLSFTPSSAILISVFQVLRSINRYASCRRATSQVAVAAREWKSSIYRVDEHALCAQRPRLVEQPAHHVRTWFCGVSGEVGCG